MFEGGDGPQCRSCLAENGSKMSSCCAIYESLGGATSVEAEAIKGGIQMCNRVCQPRYKSWVMFQSGDEEGEARWACRVAGDDDSGDDDDEQRNQSKLHRTHPPKKTKPLRNRSKAALISQSTE